MSDQRKGRFNEAVGRFDQANALDPNRTVFEGREHPKELLYAQRMTQWLERLEPNASEPLRLAARCQHIRRWEIPRSSFPQDRAGYLNWRKTLYQFHADRAGEILHDVGYDSGTIERVQSLLKKEKLKADPEMQTLEDVICLVFLENYFSDFAREKDEQKVMGIIKRTWIKMSDRGREMALAQIRFSEADMALIRKALEPPAV
jgi:hypothetical protein